MRRVVRVIGAGGNEGAPRLDSVILAGDQRRVQTAHLTGVNGTPIGLMLPQPVLLRMGDTLELDDGSLIDVVVEPEALVEVRGNDLTHLARLAWHLGDRHVPVQVLNNRLRIRRDVALETTLGKLGARLAAIDAPFDPEGGAYAAQTHHARYHADHGHAHDHDHHHDHAPGHVHGPGCGHDH